MNKWNFDNIKMHSASVKKEVSYIACQIPDKFPPYCTNRKKIKNELIYSIMQCNIPNFLVIGIFYYSYFKAYLRNIFVITRPKCTIQINPLNGVPHRQGWGLSLVNTFILSPLNTHTYIYIYYLSIFSYVLQLLVTYSFVYRAELRSC